MEKENSNTRKSMNKCDTCSRKMFCKEVPKHNSVKECIAYIYNFKNYKGNVIDYVAFTSIIIIILGILLSGCDNLKCHPQFDIDGKYIGIVCGGDF